MTTYFPGVLTKQGNLATLTANVGNLDALVVRSFPATANVLVTDAQCRVVSSSVPAATLSFLAGVTSSIQTQLDAKLDRGVAVANLALSGQTASRVLGLDASSAVVSTPITLTQLGHLGNVTSDIQGQLSGKQAAITGAASSIAAADLAASRALISDASGKVAVSAITSAELDYLSGVTSAVQLQLNAKQATITGAATSIAASDLSASRAVVSDGSGKVAASGVTAAELGYLAGATSGIQGQLDGKQGIVTGAASSITGTNLTASRALVSDGSGKVAASNVTATELGYLAGATGNIQAQLNAVPQLTEDAVFEKSVTVNGNLTVLGNTTTLSTQQLAVEDPVVVLNQGRLDQTTGLYLQAAAANVAVVLRSGWVEMFNTTTAPDAEPSPTTYTPLKVGSLAATAATFDGNVACGNASVTGSLAVTPPGTSGHVVKMAGALDAAGTTHTVDLGSVVSGGASAATLCGQLVVFVTNSDATSANKTGYAVVSLINGTPDFDVVPICVHRNVNLATFELGKIHAARQVVVQTDSDCAIAWRFDGYIVS